MNYLIYIELAAENLQFFLWHRDYKERFAKLPAREQALSPPWKMDASDAEKHAAYPKLAPKASPEAAAILKGTDFEKVKINTREVGPGNPFNTPPRTPNHDSMNAEAGENNWSEDGSTVMGTHSSTIGSRTANAFENAEHLQPCMTYPTVEPYLHTNVVPSHRATIPRGDLSCHRYLHR